MIDTSMFFKNPFNSRDVSDEELKKFTEEHLKQLSESNKDGYFTTMISETIAAYNDYYHPEDIPKSSMEISQEQDKEKQRIFEEFVKLVNLKEKSIRYISEEISAIIYREFFPAGLDEFKHASLTDADRLFSRTINAANNHIKEFGQQFVNQLVELKKRYSEVRKYHFKHISEINNDVNKHDLKDRSLLERQLMKNLLTFAIVYISEPDIGITFFSRNSNQIPNEDTSKHRERVRKQNNQFKT